MNDASIKRFQKQAALFSASPASKCVAIPWKLAWSTAVQKICMRKGGIVSTKAHTFWGSWMNVVLPEAMSCSIYRYGFLEEGLTAAFIHLLKPGMTVFDIGTHFGYFTMLASELVGPAGAVYSFEPTPSTFEVLQSNVARLSNVHLNNCAVYCEEKQMEFQDFGAQFSAYNSIRGSRLDQSILQQATLKRCVVQAITLDGYVARTARRRTLSRSTPRMPSWTFSGRANTCYLEPIAQSSLSRLGPTWSRSARAPPQSIIWCSMAIEPSTMM